MKQKAESKPVENNSINIEVDHNENTQKKLSRKKRGFEIREAELIASKNKDDSKKTNEIDSEDISVSNAPA
jgi:hypothetical protein